MTARPLYNRPPTPLLDKEGLQHSPVEASLPGPAITTANALTATAKPDMENEAKKEMAAQSILERYLLPRLHSGAHQLAVVGSVLAAGLTVWAETKLGVSLLAPESKNLLHTGVSAVLGFVNAAEFDLRREPGSRWFSVAELLKAGNMGWAVVSLLLLIDATSGQSLSRYLKSIFQYLIPIFK